MKDCCPQCGAKFGLHGPAKSVGETCYCPVCSTKLQYTYLLPELIASFLGFIGVLLGPGNVLWQHLGISSIISLEVVFIGYAMFFIGAGFRLISFFMLQHYTFAKNIA